MNGNRSNEMDAIHRPHNHLTNMHTFTHSHNHCGTHANDAWANNSTLVSLEPKTWTRHRLQCSSFVVATVNTVPSENIYSNVQLNSMAKRTCWDYSLFTKWIGRKLSQSLSTVLKQMIKFGLLIDFDYIRRVICMLNWVNEWCLAYENGLRKTKSANCLTDHNLLLFTIYTTAFRFFFLSCFYVGCSQHVHFLLF